MIPTVLLHEPKEGRGVYQRDSHTAVRTSRTKSGVFVAARRMDGVTSVPVVRTIKKYGEMHRGVKAVPLSVPSTAVELVGTISLVLWSLW